MDDISNSKKETEQNISTMKKNIKDAENIINHIDKNIDNLNKGIEVRFRTFALSVYDNLLVNQKCLNFDINLKIKIINWYLYSK